MPKVSPLRLLMGSSPKGAAGHSNKERDQLLEDEISSSCPKSTEAATTTPRAKKGISFATVYPHSENVPENLITPEKKAKAKFSWYQRQVKNLGADVEAGKKQQQSSVVRNPQTKPVTPRSSRIDQSHSTTGSSSNQEPNATPKKTISRTLRYSAQPAAAASLGSTNATPPKTHQNFSATSSAQTQPQHFELEHDSSFWVEHNVQVLIRIRPLNSQEVAAQGHERCLRQESAHSLSWIGNPDTRFTFDHVACETITQEKLFKVAGMPMVGNCMRGYNSCIFAYGQTGSGKTHTMLGNINRKNCDDRGLTPRVFEHLFETIRTEEEGRRNEKLKYTCKCSFLEIYNEQITDLLEPSLTNLQVREDGRRGVYVENLTEVEVNCVQDVTGVLLQGAANRKVAATNMNRESSRSHSVLTCVIESKWERDSVTNRRFGRLNLVDLAGSERQKATGAESERLKEAVNINKSLSTLGLVIMVLVDVANGKQRHVPYRDSKLTYLLQESLGGNSKTMIISTVSPSVSCAMDTLSTLKFAQRAKFICNNAVVNEDTSRDVNILRQQIHKLKEEVNRLRNQSSGTCSSPSSPDDYDTDSHTELRKRPTRSRGQDDINKMLSAEFHKLNQLRESLEAELETKPFQNESYQRKLQDSHLENEKLRREITELQAALDAPQKEHEQQLRREMELLELNHSKSMADLEVLLKESEESRIVQATSIRNLELAVSDYRAETRELKSQLKEAKDVQEQMESQQLFLISEFETVLQEHNKISEKLARTEAREQLTKDQLRLLNWEVKKKNEVQDLEKELEIRASAETLLGYVDEEEKRVLEEKLRKTRKDLEEARTRNHVYQGEEASRLAAEKQMEVTRSEVEAETANALASMNRDLLVAKDEIKASNEQAIRLMEELEELKVKCRQLTDENAGLVRAYDCVVQDRDMEIQELQEHYEDATTKLFDFLMEGDQALAIAAKEMEDIIQESFSAFNASKKEDGALEYQDKLGPIEVLQNKLHQAFSIAKDAERKLKAFSEQQKYQYSETNQLKVQFQAAQEHLKEAEKKAQVAFLVVRHLQSKSRTDFKSASSASDLEDQKDWKAEKEELIAELTEAKLEAAAKSKETTTVLQKFKDSQHMLQEAEQLLNALVKANENAKTGAAGWKDEMRKSMSLLTSLPEKDDLNSKLDKAKHDLHLIREEIGACTFDSVHALTDAEQEVRSTMQSIEANMKDIMSSVFNFGDGIRDEFVDLRDKMTEMMGEANSLLGEIRRKNELLKGLEYDISLLQEAFSEAHEKKLELQDENERMQDELELKTSEINGAETQLLKLLTTLTTVEAELRSLKDTAGYLSTENRTQRKQIEELEANNGRLEEELEVKKRLVQSLDAELLEVSSLVERYGSGTSDADVSVVFRERDELQAELCTVREQLERSRDLIEELELVAEKSRQISENSQVLANEKDEEIKVLDRSVQELESTITAMENQISLLKRDGEMNRSVKEDLEMELQRLRGELSRSKVQTTDYAGIPVDKIKLLRLEEELESLLEECRLKDAQVSSLRKHVSELMDTATKEACGYRRKIKRLEASLETRCVPKQAAREATAKVKGSGSPFKCMGLSINPELSAELSTNKRRVEELEAVASVREKEVFMLNAKLAQAESMTYDVVRDLLEVKHEISSFVHLDERDNL